MARSTTIILQCWTLQPNITAQLPLSSVVEEFKVAKARLVKTLRDSRDDKIRNAGIQTRTGRKWSAGQSFEQAKTMLKLRDIVGATCSGSQGL